LFIDQWNSYSQKSSTDSFRSSTNGTFDTSRSVLLDEIRLPEFANNRCIKGVQARIFDYPTCQYDIILGRDFLRAAGIKLCFSTDTMQWWDRIIDMKIFNHYESHSAFITEINELLEEEEDHELFSA